MKNTQGLTRFVESGVVDNKLLKKVDNAELNESLKRCPAKLTESVKDSAEGWWVPISFYNKKNLNNRIYNRKLWENVINNQKETYVGSPMLTDHPAGDSDGNPRDICGVWLDAKMDEPDLDGVGLVWGLLVPSGRLGDDLRDHIKHGLKVGTSSSGFGDMMPDGVTVDPDTYQIERLADFVLCPSQGTYFSYDEDDDQIDDKSIKESLEAHRNIKETTTVKDSKIAKLEEKKFRRDMESFLEEANNIKDPQARLEEFREIRSFLEDGACPDLKEKIEAKIAEQEASIKKMLQESVEYKERFGIESPKDLEEKLTMLSEDTKVIESESANWKKISETLQTKLNKTKEDLNARPSTRYVKYVESKNTKLQNEMLCQNKKAAEVVNNLIKAYEKLKAENSTLKESTANTTVDYKKLKEEAETLKKECDDKATSKDSYKKAYIDLKDAFGEATNEMNELASKNEKLTSRVNSYREKLSQLRADLSRKERDYESLRKAYHDLKENVRAKETEEAREALREDIESDPVASFYESIYKTYGSQISPYANKILSSANLTEAKRVFYADVIQNLKESKDIEDSRIPMTSYITASERQDALGLKSLKKSTIMDRKPEGWL
jgi:predicted nuclease with TOPRIM domain|nr:MAG TPA_asm: Prohead core protein serine protease [Caudoviricetes sp.]